MANRTFVISLVAGVLAFAAGFLAANAINRNELLQFRADNERFKNAAAGSSTNQRLRSNALSGEISSAIQKADQQPGDATTQRIHGTALYRYAAMKQDIELLRQSIRILSRASTLAPEDRDIKITLGNAHFDVGYFSKDNASLAKAREIYSGAMAAKPTDVEVRTDIGLTYFLETPPDNESAVAEFRKGLDINPNHEKTLQFIVQALINQRKPTEAAEYLEHLRTVNPQNRSISELAKLLADANSPVR